VAAVAIQRVLPDIRLFSQSVCFESIEYSRLYQDLNYCGPLLSRWVVRRVEQAPQTHCQSGIRLMLCLFSSQQ
jgi:hypothetical protein